MMCSLLIIFKLYTDIILKVKLQLMMCLLLIIFKFYTEVIVKVKSLQIWSIPGALLCQAIAVREKGVLAGNPSSIQTMLVFFSVICAWVRTFQWALRPSMSYTIWRFLLIALDRLQKTLVISEFGKAFQLYGLLLNVCAW